MSRNIWFTADSHFDHANIIKHCNRPFSSLDEMNDVLLQRYNACVKRGDTVYIVGDLAFRNHAKWLSKLNGSKILIKGNHDKMNQDCYRQFAGVYDLLQTSINKKMIVLCHYALRTWNGSFHGSYHLYGHSHGRLLEGGRTGLSFDIGVDCWNFFPIPWETVEAKMKVLKEDVRDLRILNPAGKVLAELDSNVQLVKSKNINFISNEKEGER